MKRLGRSWVQAIAQFALLVTLLGLAPVALAQGIAVVTNPDVEIDGLSFTELKKILRGDREFWSSGQPITLVVRAPVAAERTVLLTKVYEMSEAQYRQYWISKVFRAQAASEPRIVLSSDETAELLAVVKGAIGLIRADEVPEGLKILRVEGKLPGEADYPLAE